MQFSSFVVQIRLEAVNPANCSATSCEVTNDSPSVAASENDWSLLAPHFFPILFFDCTGTIIGTDKLFLLCFETMGN
ncbi:hypothetical protein Nmel_007361 [Mimus melanotis]